MIDYIPLKQLLEDYKSGDTYENECKQKMLEFLSFEENCFARECLYGHFTASAFVINKDANKMLLMHHTKLDKWIQLGGHCDKEQDVLAVALKEAAEESGIKNIKPVLPKIFDIDIHIIPQIHNVPAHLHYDIRFMLQVYSDEKLVPNRESKELKWFSKEDSLPTNSPSIMRMYKKWIRLL